MQPPGNSLQPQDKNLLWLFSCFDFSHQKLCHHQFIVITCHSCLSERCWLVLSLLGSWSRSAQGAVSWITSTHLQSCSNTHQVHSIPHLHCASPALRRSMDGLQGALWLLRKWGPHWQIMFPLRAGVCQSPFTSGQCCLLSRFPVPGLCVPGTSFACGTTSQVSKQPQSLFF